MSYAISANRLSDGIVVFLAGNGWVEALAGAMRFPDKNAAAAAIDGRAKADVARNVIIEPALFEVIDAAQPAVAAHIREAIRANGPSVRPDLGKQASPQG